MNVGNCVGEIDHGPGISFDGKVFIGILEEEV